MATVLLLWALIVIVAFSLGAYYLIYERQIKRWKQSNIPFLQPIFLVGNKYLFSAAKYSISVPVDQIYKENKDKDLIAFFLGTLPVILLKNQKLIRQVFAKNFSQPFADGFSSEKSEEGNSKQDEFQFIRNMGMPVFSLNWFKGSRIESIKEALYELLQNAEEKESDGFPMIVKKVTKNAILQISSSNLGIDRHSQATKNSLRSITDAFFEPSYARMIMFYSLFHFPSLQKFERFKILPTKSKNIMSDILNNIFNHRDRNKIEKGDFADTLRALRSTEESKNNCSQDLDVHSINKGVSMERITMVALGYVLSGSDTVQELIDFTIHALSLYPEYQSKIRSEVREALNKHGVSEFNFDVIRSLSFTYQCLFEASRLYPNTPFIMRECSEDFQLLGTNYIFKKGDIIAFSAYSTNRDPIQFSNPDSFDPKRFISKDGSLAIPGMLLSFGTGPKKCPGYTHGLFVAAAILAALLNKYEIRPRSHLRLMDNNDFCPKGFTICPRRDILVDLVRCENVGDI